VQVMVSATFLVADSEDLSMSGIRFAKCQIMEREADLAISEIDRKFSV
jgi:hypothetical protein